MVPIHPDLKSERACPRTTAGEADIAAQVLRHLQCREVAIATCGEAGSRIRDVLATTRSGEVVDIVRGIGPAWNAVSGVEGHWACPVAECASAIAAHIEVVRSVQAQRIGGGSGASA